MSAFSADSLRHLGQVKPITAARAVAMEQYVTAHGGDIFIPADGGLRTMARQAELARFRDDSVAAGGAYYAVHSPNKNARHTTGDAFDVHVLTPMDGMSVSETYHAMAVYAPTLGLKAGYFFGGGPPSQRADPFHFENLDPSVYDAPPMPDGGGGDAPASDGSLASDSLPPSPDAGPVSWLELDPGATIGLAAIVGVVVMLWLRKRNPH